MEKKWTRGRVRLGMNERVVRMRRAFVLGLAVLATLWSTTAIAGRIHLKYGYAIEAEYWWEDGPMLYYVRRHGQLTEATPRSDVERIEGTPKFPDNFSWNPQGRSWDRRPLTLQVPAAPSQGVPATSGSRTAPFAFRTVAKCPWRTAPQCLHTFSEGTFRAWGETSGDIRKWLWRLFVANPGPAKVIDLRLEFQNAELSFDYVKRCRIAAPASSTLTIEGEHTIRASASPVWTIDIQVDERTNWC